METKPDPIKAHEHSSDHRAELLASERCGCFYCGAIFPASAITCWIWDEQTALCPRCDIDSVIGDASGYPISAEFLARMKAHWFDA